jgi:glutathione S-transferase
VWLDPCTINCRKVLAGLDLLGIDFKEHTLSYFAGDQKSEEYTKINPMQTIPAARDGDCIITESNAILQYAADHVQHNDSAYPKDLKKRADVNRWLLWEASVWFASNYKYLIENVVQPILGKEPDNAITSGEDPNYHKLAGVLDAQLAKTKYLTGDDPTIADIAVAAPMHLWQEAKVPIEPHPNLKRWMQDIEKLPSWQKTDAGVRKAFGLGQ